MRIRFLRPLACLLLASTPGCKLFQTAVNVPGQLAQDLTGGRSKPTNRVPPSTLQAGVMRFADTFASRVTQATQDFADKADTPEARIQALSWTTGQCTAAFTIATGPNPNVALLDMIVLVTLGRMVHEEYWLPKVWGEPDRAMVEAYTQLEMVLWGYAEQMLAPAQLDDVRATLRAWRDENPDMGITAFVKLPMFQDLFKAGPVAAGQKGPNLGDLLNMDPLSGLEPAVREIEQARLLAERSMFYLQRAPILLSKQVELLGLKLMRIPEVHRALDDSQRISQAAASLAETAAALPEAVRAEREAAVKQIADALAQQRQGLVADLESAEAPSRKILTEARATLEAGTQMSAALQATITTLNTFLGRFDEKPAPAGAPPAPAPPPGKPFDITEYGDTATRLGSAAHEIDGLLHTLDERLPEVRKVVDEAAARGERTIDHAFVRALQCGLALIVAAALATLLVRRLSRGASAAGRPPA